MSDYSLAHLGDRALERELTTAALRHRGTSAVLIAHIAEFDARKLYLPAAYPSMYAYCMGQLGMWEQAALKHLRAARAARQFPVIFEMLADGRLHLSAIVLLVPHLTKANSAELLASAAGQSKSALEQLLARRFPQPDLPARLEALSPTGGGGPLSPGTVEACGDVLSPGAAGELGLDASEPAPGEFRQLSPGTVEPLATSTQRAPAPVAPPAPRAKLKPLSPERFGLQVTIGRSTYEKLQHAQALLGHQIAAGDLASVVDRALDALIEQLEKQKFAATSSPRKRAPRASGNPRHIPAEVKRAVWRRDQGQCTFVSESGQRCPEKTRLEYDHAEPVARGGRASIEGIRLRCRAHNQHAAECAFGVGFMDEKRREARRATEARAARTPDATRPREPGPRRDEPVAAAGDAAIAAAREATRVVAAHVAAACAAEARAARFHAAQPTPRETRRPSNPARAG